MVTPFPAVAKAFSHKPTLVSLSDDCQTAKHNGQLRGYLYRVSEAVVPEDLTCLSGTAETHWETQRELQVALIGELPVDDPPQLASDEIVRMRAAGTGFFTSLPD
jgi:hypothetical protein